MMHGHAPGHDHPRGPGAWRAGRGGGPGRGRPAADLPGADDAAAWFSGRLPDDWFTGAPEVTVDREEVVVVGTLPDLAEAPEDDDARAAAEAGRISRFREDTRTARMEIARQAQARYGRDVAWGARVGGSSELFTSAAVPVMTRLRQPQRQVLDTLVDAGVARSRSEALAWCVRLVGEHADDWLGQLRDALKGVEDLRSGPEL
ncbi:hypothetical protein GCM10027047_28600 [Rhodococcus aerolatus]